MTWANQPGPDGRRKGWWVKTAVAGLIGGAAMMLFLMLSYSAMGLGAWFPANGIATVLPNFRPVPGALPVGEFVAAQSVTGLLIHGLLSAGLGVVFGAFVEGFMEAQARSLPWQALAGFIYSTFVWMFFGFGGVYLAGLQPVFGTATFFFSHLIFGVVLGISLALMTTKRDMMSITFAPEEKKVVEPARRR